MSDEQITTRFGLPKGSLQDQTLELFRKAGWDIHVSSRSYRPSVDDTELDFRLLRAQEIGRYVDLGFLDAGITGKDWVAENEADVHVVCDLPYSRATSKPTRWVVVVPENSSIRTVQDLQGKVISSEAVGLTRKFLSSHGVEAEVEFSWGATEVKVPELADAIVDITETGSSLVANKLRIVATIMESYPQLIVNHKAWENPVKQAKILQIQTMLGGALFARDLVGLKMNAPSRDIETILATLPSLRRPTVSPLSEEGWSAVETVIQETIVRNLIPQLKSLGAEGIIEYPLNKVIT